MRQAVSDNQAVQVPFDDEVAMNDWRARVNQAYQALEHGELAELEPRMDFEESEKAGRLK